MAPRFFKRQADFHVWLEAHHNDATELWVGFKKTHTGKESITWPQAVEEALCFGWIDGLRKSIDEESYQIRFTPRKPASTWSHVNIELVERLRKEGRMRAAGLRAFAARSEARSRAYSYENKPSSFDEGSAKRFRANKNAWAFFDGQAASYKRTAMYWVMSAKREETRAKRLEELIAASEKGERPAPFIPSKRTRAK